MCAKCQIIIIHFSFCVIPSSSASLITHQLIEALRRKPNPPIIPHPERTSVNISVCILPAWNILREQTAERLRISQGLANLWPSQVFRRLFLSLLSWCCFHCISESLRDPQLSWGFLTLSTNSGPVRAAFEHIFLDFAATCLYSVPILSQPNCRSSTFWFLLRKKMVF